MPESPNQPYNMCDLIRAVVDQGEFLEVPAHYARNSLAGFPRLAGRGPEPGIEPCRPALAELQSGVQGS